MATWNVGIQTTSTNQTFGIEINGTNPNITVDWGNGLVETFTTTGAKTRTYATAGNYTVKISGSLGSSGQIQLGANNEQRARVISTSEIPTIPGLTNLQEAFFNCTSLTVIPSNLFSNNPGITNFISTFDGCSSLTSIPAGLFANNAAATNFTSTFYRCSSLTSIPTGLFDNNTAVTSFDGIFGECSSLTIVPAGLFANNIAVTGFGFVSTFIGVGLTTLSYSNLLMNMASNAASRQNNVSFNGGNSRYNLAGQAAKQTLEAKGWTFTDLGLDTTIFNILSGINVTDPITINDEFAEFPTHYDIYGYGGYHCVQNITERNIIPSGRRKEGMLIYTAQEDKNWLLSGDINNSNWVEINVEKEYKNLFLNNSNQQVSDIKNFISRPTVSGVVMSLPGDPESSVSLGGFNVGNILFNPQTNLPYINFIERQRVNNIMNANVAEVSPSTFTCSHSFYTPNRSGETIFFDQLTNLSPSRSDINREFQLPFPATIIGASLTVNLSTTGVGPNRGMVSILDKTTKIHYKLIDNIFYNFTRQSFIESGLKIDLQANRKYVIRLDTPNLTTGPSLVRHQLNLSLVNRSNTCTLTPPDTPVCPSDSYIYDKLAILNNSGCITGYSCTPRLPAFIPPVIGSDYIFKQQILPDSTPSQYGAGIAMSDDNSVIAIGALSDPEGNANGGLYAGAIYIYTGSKNNGWIFKQKLLGDNLAGQFINSSQSPPGYYYGESLGSSVSLNHDGSIIFAGARLNATLSNSYGAGKIYTGSKTNGWQLKQTIVPPLIDKAILSPAWFGVSSAISSGGDILALGGPQYNITGTLITGSPRIQGAVALYTGNKENGWVFKQMVTGNNIRRSGFANGIRAGWSVSMKNDGSVIVVGCPIDMPESLNGFGNGSILIFTGKANNGWNLKQHIFDNSLIPSGFQRPYFGGSVSISNNNIIAVGASNKLNSQDVYVGGVYIYSGTPQTNWNLIQSIDGNSPNGKFGESICFNKASGSSLIIGSPFVSAGVSTLYDKSNSLSFTTRQTFFGNTFSTDTLLYGRSNWISQNSDIVLYTSPNESVGVGTLLIYILPDLVSTDIILGECSSDAFTVIYYNSTCGLNVNCPVYMSNDTSDFFNGTFFVHPSFGTPKYLYTVNNGIITNKELCSSSPIINPPTNISVLSRNPTSFDITWNKLLTTYSFYFDVSTDNSFTSFIPFYENRLAFDQGFSLITFTDIVTGLSPGTTYYARVRSEFEGNVSANSSTLTGITQQLDSSSSSSSSSSSLTVNSKELSEYNDCNGPISTAINLYYQGPLGISTMLYTDLNLSIPAPDKTWGPFQFPTVIGPYTYTIYTTLNGEIVFTGSCTRILGVE